MLSLGSEQYLIYPLLFQRPFGYVCQILAKPKKYNLESGAGVVTPGVFPGAVGGPGGVSGLIIAVGAKKPGRNPGYWKKNKPPWILDHSIFFCFRTEHPIYFISP